MPDRDLAPRSAEFSKSIMTELVLPQHTNAYGTCFGGTILSWIDIAAGICARRHAGAQAVTVAFDDVHFITPIRLGDIVNITARVCHAGRTSMEIRVEVWRERHDGDREHANTAYVVFVAVDADGRPLPVPGLAVGSQEDRARYEEAVERRQMRMTKVKRAAMR